MTRLHFELRKPCPGCPFLKDGPGVNPVRLRAGRVEEIWESTKHHGTTFQCHKTVDYSDPDDEGNEHPIDRGRPQHCIGAVIAGLNSGEGPVQTARVVAALGMDGLDLVRLHREQGDRVFSSLDEMLETAL